MTSAPIISAIEKIPTDQASRAAVLGFIVDAHSPRRMAGTEAAALTIVRRCK